MRYFIQSNRKCLLVSTCIHTEICVYIYFKAKHKYFLFVYAFTLWFVTDACKMILSHKNTKRTCKFYVLQLIFKLYVYLEKFNWFFVGIFHKTRVKLIEYTRSYHTELWNWRESTIFFNVHKRQTYLSKIIPNIKIITLNSSPHSR